MDVRKLKDRAREFGLAACFIAAGGCVTYGASMLSAAAGWIVGGALLGLIGWLVLGEV